MIDGALLPIAECRLEFSAMRTQRDRYRAVGRHLERVERHPCRLDARFTPGLDSALLRETIEVERQCCPFFAIEHDPAEYRLSVTVGDPAQESALDALEFALTSD